MRLRTLFLSALAVVATATLALQAQVPGVNSTLQSVFTLAYDNSTMKPTFSANGTLAAAASATDICVLSGSATKTVKVRRVYFTGNATAVSSLAVAVVKRSTAASGGTSTVLTQVPYDSQNGAGTVAVAETFTANPTVGTLVGVLADVYYTYNNLTTGVGQGPYTFTFGQLGQPVVLRGVAQSIAVNLGGATVAGGVITCGFEWTEDSDS